MIESPFPSRLGWGHRLFRRAAVWLAGGFFPEIRQASPGCLERVVALAREGFGVLLIINHFSLRDPLQAFKLVATTPALRERFILAPVAFHQVLLYGRPGLLLAWLLGVQVQPVVTKETIRRMGRDRPKDSGLERYRHAAAVALAAGQIVLLAPQAGRRARLGRPVGQPVAALLKACDEAGSKRFLLLPVGLGLEGAAVYGRETTGGFNWGQRYLVHLGEPLTPGELLGRGEGLDGIDDFVFNQLADLTPSTYAAPSSSAA